MVEEASVMERLLSDVLADPSRLPVIELDWEFVHRRAVVAEPVEWPAPAAPLDEALAEQWRAWEGSGHSAPDDGAEDGAKDGAASVDGAAAVGAVPAGTATGGAAGAGAADDGAAAGAAWGNQDARVGAAAWRPLGLDDSAAPGSAATGPAPLRVSASADPGGEVAALSVALDAIAAQDPSVLPQGQALARARRLLQAVERMRALSAEALADVEARRLFTADDSPSVTAWVAGLAVPGVDGREMTLARRLSRVPRVREELKAGRLSGKAAAVIGTAVSRARPFLDRPDGQIDGLVGEQVLTGVLVDGVCSLLAEQLGGDADAESRLGVLRTELAELTEPTALTELTEPTELTGGHDAAGATGPGGSQLARWEAALVVFARECDPALLASGVALLVDALLPNEHDKRARQAGDDRGLDLHRNSAGSGWSVRGALDDETGELLATVLDAAAGTDPAGPQDTARHAEGRQALEDDTLPPAQWPADQPAPRSRRQQRHDALRRGLAALLDSGALGVRGRVAPHVAVTVDLDFLHAVPGSLPARTTHGARLSRQQVRRLLCRSTFTRLVLDARRRVLEVSHTQRTHTAVERLILKVQGGAVCSGAGCGRGPATGHRLIPHHASLFSHTGSTELADTALLCERDHDHHLHHQRRSILLKDGRILGPDGWVRR